MANEVTLVYPKANAALYASQTCRLLVWLGSPAFVHVAS